MSSTNLFSRQSLVGSWISPSQGLLGYTQCYTPSHSQNRSPVLRRMVSLSTQTQMGRRLCFQASIFSSETCKLHNSKDEMFLIGSFPVGISTTEWLLWLPTCDCRGVRGSRQKSTFSSFHSPTFIWFRPQTLLGWHGRWSGWAASILMLLLRSRPK